MTPLGLIVIANCLLVNPATSFMAIPKTISHKVTPSLPLPFISNHGRHTTTHIQLSSAPGDDENNELVTGSEEMQAKLKELESKYPTSESAYIAASKARAEEGRRKMLEEAAREEAAAEERRRKREEGAAAQQNVGPGDLSSYVGFEDDGFEASAGNDGAMAPLMSEGVDDEEEEEAPSLIIPGEEDTDSGGLLL